MADKKIMYRVLEDQKYTGKHRVYCGKGAMGRTTGDLFPESELFGNADNLKMALEGSDDVMKRFPSTKDDDGKEVPGKEFVAIKGKERKIVLVDQAKKVKKAKASEKVNQELKDMKQELKESKKAAEK